MGIYPYSSLGLEQGGRYLKLEVRGLGYHQGAVVDKSLGYSATSIGG